MIRIMSWKLGEKREERADLFPDLSPGLELDLRLYTFCVRRKCFQLICKHRFLQCYLVSMRGYYRGRETRYWSFSV